MNTKQRLHIGPVVAAVAFAMAAVTLPTGAARASAEPARTPGNPQIDCRGWLRPGPHTVTRAEPIYHLGGGSWTGEVHVTLWRGYTTAGPHYWATLTGKTRPGDAVWLDVKNDAGWHQCGPFGVGSPDQTISSPMGYDLHFHAFRACGRHNNESDCTSSHAGVSRR